jgi:hypothetical protein
VRIDNEVAGKPVPVVICHTECPVVAAGVLCLISATKRIRPDRALRPFFTLAPDMNSKKGCERASDGHWV